MKIFKIIITLELIWIAISLFNLCSPYHILILKKNTSPKTEYIAAAKWNEICWGKALKELEKLKKEDISCQMILGWRNGEGHAWIEYVENGKVIKYDPTFDRRIK